MTLYLLKSHTSLGPQSAYYRFRMEAGTIEQTRDFSAQLVPYVICICSLNEIEYHHKKITINPP